MNEVYELIYKVWSIDFENNLGFSLYVALFLVTWLQSQTMRMKFKILSIDRDMSISLPF